MIDYANAARENLGRVSTSTDYRAQEIYIAAAQVNAILDLAAAIREFHLPARMVVGVPDNPDIPESQLRRWGGEA